MIRHVPLRRSSWGITSGPRKPIARRVKVRARNPKRRQSEFARCYHSRERVRWVKGLPCFACVSLSPIFALVPRESDNAHTVTDGAGRKAGYETIAPLCRSHHRRYDEHRAPFDTDETRKAVRAFAADVERRWQERAG